MSTELIATTAGGQAASADIVAAAGTPVTLFLKSGTSESLPQDAKAVIEIKSTTSATYYAVGELNQANPAKVIDGAGTYRVVKSNAGVYGVDQG